MGIFNQRKNKKYSYKARYSHDPIEIKPKFDEFRSTIGDNQSFKEKLKLVLKDSRSNQEKPIIFRILIIALLLLLLFLFFIDFDLSIFI